MAQEYIVRQKSVQEHVQVPKLETSVETLPEAPLREESLSDENGWFYLVGRSSAKGPIFEKSDGSTGRSLDPLHVSLLDFLSLI